ncbi:NAD(P)H-dependent oxidoreductase [Haloferula rosea]|uniref:NAD(P)H-dependent oxidoreductase n=1 Tax=Haloferula rosea TaxID=490093 RepID=A0A934VAN0_9BACT|nr:NAD(P)H-dependent oxidoreductase [Haloferula rosea]MBK1826488.1 NAD(P)H-dependent oxidoreductase [Haloferula rosea]
MTPAELTSALQWRYATKVFDPSRSIPSETWEALVDALVAAPSSFGLQPWKFFIVDDTAKRAQLREVSWGQSQVTDADKLVVFAARTDMTPADTERWLTRLASVHGQAPDELTGLGKVIDGFCNNMTVEGRHAWNVRQTYIALGQFMAAAAMVGVDTCPLEGLDPKSYDKILGLEDSGYATCVACAAGYRSGDDKYASRPKARFERDEVVEHR